VVLIVGLGRVRAVKSFPYGGQIACLSKLMMCKLTGRVALGECHPTLWVAD